MRPLLIAIVALILAGCSGRVQVVDPAGKPVQGAQVAPVTLSMNGAAAATDAKGEAEIPLSIGGQSTKWVNVSKAGFQSQQIAIPANWPLKVVLKP
jgi:hypothetical protein